MPSLSVDGATLHYRDTGPRSAPIIIFGHGLLLSADIFRRSMSALERSYRCVAIDWRGHGGSRSLGDFSAQTFTDDLIKLLDVIDDPRARRLRGDAAPAIHYVGHGVGAYAVIPLAAARPDLFRSLTLIGASARAEHPDQAHSFLKLACRYRHHLGSKSVTSHVEELLFSPAALVDKTNRRALTRWREQARQVPRGELRASVRAVADRPGVQVEASNIQTPTQIIAGTLDAVVAAREAVHLTELVKGSRLHWISGCGHVPMMDQPARLTRLIQSFCWQADHLATWDGQSTKPLAVPLPTRTPSGRSTVSRRHGSSRAR